MGIVTGSLGFNRLGVVVRLYVRIDLLGDGCDYDGT